MSSTSPHMSVVVVSYNSRRTIQRTLASLREQSYRDFEDIVVDSSSDGTAALVEETFPEARVIHFPDRRYPGDGRNAGIAAARGELVAFLDSDCVADRDWAGAIAAAHRSPHLIIGGSIDSASPSSRVGDGALFASFSQWLPGTPAGPMDDIPTCSLSMKREAYERFGPFLEGTYCSDTAFNWRAAASGVRPVFDPTIRINHINLTTLGDVTRKMLMHGRSFARVRTQQRALSIPRRVCLGLGSATLLPPLLYARTFARVLKTHRRLGAFLLATPVVLAAQACWSIGELLGYADAKRRTPIGTSRSAA